MVNLKEVWSKKALVALGLGQLLSLLITSTGFSSSQLARKGINAPTSQSFFNYVLLALVYGGIMIYRQKPLKAKWYHYVVLGLVDVEANYLVVKAYQYTSLTSVMLLDCWTIPCVLLFTWFFLKTKYKCKKLVGVGICIAGLVMVVFSDVHAADRSSGSNPIKGDVLVIAGATLYAVSNVSEEFFVKSADRVELMAFLGLFGAVVSACQISILERNELMSIQWSAGATLPFVGFALAMFLFYSGVPVLLRVDWLYFVAFAAVAVGLLVYSGCDKLDENRADVADEEFEQRKWFDEEAGLANPAQKDAVGSSTSEDSIRQSFISTNIVEKVGVATTRTDRKDTGGKKF